MLDPEHTPEFDNLYGGIGPAAFELWEDARAETARLAWVPYLHNPSLPHLLGVIDKLPTLLVWGRQDKVSPLSAGEAYIRRSPARSWRCWTNAAIARKSRRTRTFSAKSKDF